MDAKGEPRILLDAGEGDGFATISLWGKEGRSIQITTGPDGRLSICCSAKNGLVTAGFGISPEDATGLSLSDKIGRCGTILGAVADTNEHALILFEDGRRLWSSRKPKAQPPKE